MTKDICPAVGEELGVLEFDQDPGRPYLRVATAEDKNLVALPCLDVCAQGAIGTETSSKVSHNNTTPTGRGGGGGGCLLHGVGWGPGSSTRWGKR